MRLPSESLCCIAGIVFRVIPEKNFKALCKLRFSRNLPTVETTTKAMEMQDITCNLRIVKINCLLLLNDLGSHGGVRLLYEIPEADLVLDKLPGPKVLLHLLPDVVGLFLHLLDDVLLPGVVFVLAAGL